MDLSVLRIFEMGFTVRSQEPSLLHCEKGLASLSGCSFTSTAATAEAAVSPRLRSSVDPEARSGLPCSCSPSPGGVDDAARPVLLPLGGFAWQVGPSVAPTAIAVGLLPFCQNIKVPSCFNFMVHNV